VRLILAPSGNGSRYFLDQTFGYQSGKKPRRQRSGSKFLVADDDNPIEITFKMREDTPEDESSAG